MLIAQGPGTGGNTATAGQASVLYLRPGPAALAWARRTVDEIKAGDPFRPVTFLVPNEYAGRTVTAYLGRHGGYANVRAIRLTEAAGEIVPPSRRFGSGALSVVLELSAVAQAAQRQRALLGDPDHPSLRQALRDLFRELRRLEKPVGELRNAADSQVALAALAAYEDFRDLTGEYRDLTALVDEAARCLRSARAAPPALARLGALVLFLPTRLDPADARLLAAAARWVPLYAAFAHLADPTGLADERGRAAAALLSRELGLPAPILPPAPPALSLPAGVKVLLAPDPAEEVREVLRLLLADLERPERPVPLHRAAILYRQADSYAGLVRDALEAAEVPYASLEGRRLNESRPGRALLSLLHLSERQFMPEAMMEWLESGPAIEIASAVPPSRWNWLCRAANVVRGVEQWCSRLGALAAELEADAAQREADGDGDAAPALRSQAVDARRLAGFMAELGAALRPPPERSPWGKFVDWAEGLWARFVGLAESWPEAQRPFARDVARAVSGLREADEIAAIATPTHRLFLSALEAVLDVQSRRVGALGSGVLVGPVAAAAGLAFDRVYVLGLVEGAFPPLLPIDPFFPTSAADPLGRRVDRRAAERQAFLTALAAADGGGVVLSSPGSDGTRAAHPSRWLLEVAGICAGAPMDALSFAAATEHDNPWLRIVRSAEHGARRALVPADLEDRRLHEIVTWRGEGFDLAEHPLAGRSDLPLGAGLRAMQARRSERLTAFDGNLGEAAGRIAGIAAGGAVISASAVETWAACPFHYFLSRLLKVEPTERPEDAWAIDPRERGSLIHRVVEQFFRARQAAGKLGDADYAADDLALIESIARREFDAAAERGSTGHPLVWENARETMAADLRGLLAADRDWRRERRLTPTHFEQPFGVARPHAWPPLIMSAAGTEVRFRGFIDRIDVDPAGRRAFVLDYKTGRSDGYKQLSANPTLDGQHVQIALYARAARANLGDGFVVGGAYWFITNRGEFRLCPMPDDQEAVDRELDRVLGIVASGIREGIFPQVTDEDEAASLQCRYCDYARVCPPPGDGPFGRKQDDPAIQRYRQLQFQNGSGAE